jgi:hypothetical protein
MADGMFKIGSERAGAPCKAAAISGSVPRAVTRFTALLAALAFALLSGCEGTRVGGQSGSEGCMPEGDIIRIKVADAGAEDDDAGILDTTSLSDEPNECPAEP